MEIIFENQKTRMEFAVEDKKIVIRRISFFGKDYVVFLAGMQHSYVFLIGEAYRRKIMNRYGVGGEELYFAGSTLEADENKQQLEIVEKNDRVLVVTTYTLYNDNATIICKKSLKNISGGALELECVSPLTVKGVFSNGLNVGQPETLDEIEDPTTRFDKAHENGDSDDLPYFWRVNSTWCSEGNFERIDLAKEGLRTKSWRSRFNKVLVHNNGTMTTNRFFPFGMLEKENLGYFAFELLPAGNWSYEIETGIYEWDSQELMVCLTGKTLGDNGWSKTLLADETYETETVRIVGAPDVDTISENLLGVRRIANRKSKIKPYENVIYNGFQFNSWDHPTEENDGKNIPIVAERGADYYVIDAGWHDRGDGYQRADRAGYEKSR